MAKIDATVQRETKYIAAWVVIFSVLMQAVFLLIGKWDYTVLLGNILSATGAVLNFLFMGITVQKAVLKDEKDAKTAVRLSMIYRTLFMLAFMVVGAVVPVFNLWASLIPFLFPRLAIAIKPISDKNYKKHN